MQKNKYYTLADDVNFKYLYKNMDTRCFFNEMIKEVIGVDLINCEIIDGEIKKSRNLKGHRLDVLLKDDDKHIIYDLELNATNEKFFIKRNEEYLHLLALDVYNQYKGYTIKQINLCNYYCNRSRLKETEHIAFRNEEAEIIMKNCQIYNIYIPKIARNCYNNSIKKRFMLFRCKNYQEMASVSKNDKEMIKIMEKVKLLNKEFKFASIYNSEERDKRNLRDAEALGIEKGEAIGIAAANEKTARNMLKKKMSPNIIAEVTGLSETKVKSLML